VIKLDRDFEIDLKDFRLRCLKPEDARSLAQSCSDPEIHARIATPYPYTIKNAENYIIYCLEKWDTGAEYNFAIDIDGKVIGMISTMDINYANLRTEIGYWLGAAHRGHGIMTRAVKALINFSFDTLKLEKVFAVTHLDNPASEAVLHRAGMQKEGILRKQGLMHGVRHDHQYWGILNTD
jgi:RimJ/RimL family protein N-acetyltransferase